MIFFKQHSFAAVLVLSAVLVVAAGFPGRRAFAGSSGNGSHFELRFEAFAGGQPLVFGDSYTNVFGESYSIDRFKFYISAIRLYNETSGRTLLLGGGDSYLIDFSDSPVCVLSLVPPMDGYASQEYDRILFLLGVDSLHNVSGAQSGALDPLNGMYWTWNSGYIMAKLEGRSPVSTQPGHRFIYHIGGYTGADRAVREISLPLPGGKLRPVMGRDYHVSVGAETGSWFSGAHEIRIADHPNCMEPGPLAGRIADNYTSMFKIRETGERMEGPEPAHGGTTIFRIPAGFPVPSYNFRDNPLNAAGFELGRKLFYDPGLSKDGRISCGSCHQQPAAFASPEQALSEGSGGAFTTRNAPALFNLAWQSAFQGDGGVNHLEVQPLVPLTAANEMAETLPEILRRLQEDPVYEKAFTAAFGDGLIDSRRTLKALAQFTVSLISGDSKYDHIRQGRAAFTDREEAGYLIFRQKCAVCHREPLFTDLSYRNTGLSADPVLQDAGRMRITGDRRDSLKFKVPSLRNVLLTAPYGHDGRFRTIRAVLDHYSDGVVAGPTTDPFLLAGIRLTGADKSLLIDFLATLTDTVLSRDNRFSPPRLNP